MTRTGPNPVYRIEVWEPGAGAALYTFGNTSTDRNEILQWRYKDILTDGVGYFSFVIPTLREGSTTRRYAYYDIDLFDIVKIKHDYGTLPATWNFVGRIYDISAPLSTQQGYVRIISGLDQGEVLLRRQKTNKLYPTNNDAVLIVVDVIMDNDPELLLGFSDYDIELTHVPLEIRTMTYWDIMRAVSDYWTLGAHIQKDFKVNVNKGLVWKARGWRTGDSVPTFTVGKDIISYNVSRSVTPIRNNITVYGMAEKPLPSDKDLWTETIPDPLWTASAGSVDVFAGGGAQKVGSNYVVGYTGAGASTSTFKRTFNRITLRDINHLYCWYEIQHIDCTLAQCRLLAPNTSNYFYYDIGTANQWYFIDKPLGPSAEYHVTANPNGTWLKNGGGSPNWWDIQGIQFHNTFSANNKQLSVDGLYFYPDRWTYTATDISYGRRDLEVTDDHLHSDAQCEEKAKTLLYQLKDPPTQIEVVTPGDNNILVGDRVSMTIPAENIFAASYDIFTVEHSLSDQGYLTKTIMVNSANIREPVETSLARSIANLKVQVRRIATDLQRLG